MLSFATEGAGIKALGARLPVRTPGEAMGGKTRHGPADAAPTTYLMGGWRVVRIVVPSLPPDAFDEGTDFVG